MTNNNPASPSAQAVRTIKQALEFGLEQWDDEPDIFNKALAALEGIDAPEGTRSDEMAKAIHYPEHWDTACYQTLGDAIYEIVTGEGCSECKPAPTPTLDDAQTGGACEHDWERNNHEVIRFICKKCNGWTNEAPDPPLPTIDNFQEITSMEEAKPPCKSAMRTAETLAEEALDDIFDKDYKYTHEWIVAKQSVVISINEAISAERAACDARANRQLEIIKETYNKCLVDERAATDRLRAALQEAIKLIELWYKMQMQPKDLPDVTWKIYLEQSPEMGRLTQALAASPPCSPVKEKNDAK